MTRLAVSTSTLVMSAARCKCLATSITSFTSKAFPMANVDERDRHAERPSRIQIVHAIWVLFLFAPACTVSVLSQSQYELTTTIHGHVLTISSGSPMKLLETGTSAFAVGLVPGLLATVLLVLYRQGFGTRSYLLITLLVALLVFIGVSLRM